MRKRKNDGRKRRMKRKDEGINEGEKEGNNERKD